MALPGTLRGRDSAGSVPGGALARHESNAPHYAHTADVFVAHPAGTARGHISARTDDTPRQRANTAIGCPGQCDIPRDRNGSRGDARTAGDVVSDPGGYGTRGNPAILVCQSRSLLGLCEQHRWPGHRGAGQRSHFGTPDAPVWFKKLPGTPVLSVLWRDG